LTAETADRTSIELRIAYRSCRRINARHGRTYFLATRLLPADRRPAVHALYGFARLADDIVDEGGTGLAERLRALDALAEELRLAMAGHAAGQRTPRPVLAAVADTARRYGIGPALFTDFLRSMRMDLTITSYATFADLADYMHGSAGAIGLQMLPVLGTVCPQVQAQPHATALGEAFQLTNFLRDVGEDLDRGRVYLPADQLATFGVDRQRLAWARHTNRPDPAIRRALAHLVAYTRAVYRDAEPGIGMLRPESRPCVRTATVLYRAILDEIVAADYAVLERRLVVPRHRRLSVAVPGLVSALAARSKLRTPEPERGA
jgi:phytoene synthase